MRWTIVLLASCAVLFATAASARTTKAFLDRCETDEAACLAKIKEVRRMLEVPPPGKAPQKLCLPSGLSDEGFVFEVTYWIAEQYPPMDNRDENDSIATALISLYSCSGIKGLEGNAQ